MSAIVGERDRLLEAAVDFNLTPRQGKDLSLTVDASSFHVAVDGTPTPAYVEFTAHKIDLVGVDTWVASNGATLVGTGPTRRLYFVNMPGATAVVTLTTVEDGQIYTDKAAVSKVSDGQPGADADPNDITPEALLTSLEGRITKSQLFADLKSEINLITDPVSVAGSVQARIKTETDARVIAIGTESQQRIDAISQEVGDRIAAVLGEANARTTFVQNYTYSKQESTQALSIQASEIAAAYTTYTDQKTAQAITTASADVRTYGYSKATVDSSIAASESRLRAEFVGSGGASEAFVTNYAYSRAYIDGAEAAQSSTLTTNFQAYGDLKKSEAIAAAAADVRNYSYSKSAIDSSEAAQSSTLTANYTAYADSARDAAISAAAADARNYSYAKSAVDSAIAASESRLRAEFVGSGGATEAYVTNYAYSKAQIDQAEALQSSTLTTNLQNFANGARDQATSTAAADVRNYSYAKSAVDQAFSSQSSTITAAYTSYADAGKAQALAASAADIRNYSYSKATVDGAIASSTSSLTTTVGNHTSTLETQTNSINGLSTQFTLKSDINGYITGYGFASSANNGNPMSAFIINAGAFAVVAPGAAPRTMFTVGLVSGVAQMVLRGDAQVDGGITARMLKIGSFDNIVPDPQFKDLAWWRRVGASIGDWSAGGTGWTGGASMYIGPGNSDTATFKFPMTPGATYKVELQTNLSSDWNGYAGVYLEIAADHWDDMGQDNLYPWGDEPNTHIQYDPGSPKYRRNFSATIVVPNNGYTSQTTVRIRTQIAAGTFEWGSLCITRMSDNTLITDQGITTPKLATNSVTTDKLTASAVTTDKLNALAVTAEKITTDAIQARHIVAEAIETDKIIANGISSLDRVYTTSFTFTSVRNFKLDLTVTQDGSYNSESGVTSGGWILERYTDQGAGLGYWTTLVETFQGGLYSDTLDNLGASTATYPYYRISAKSGTGAILARIWKIFK